jgi:adenosine deaminase
VDRVNDTQRDLLLLPKIALHDHLDGGLRPATIIELAAEAGHELPSTDADALGAWFVEAASSGSLVRYLETFTHTVAVMQTAGNLARVAREAVVDLSNDGVIYAELRYAPEQHLEGGLSLQEVVEAVQAGIDAGVAEAAAAGHEIRAGALLTAMRHADRGTEIARLTLENYGRCCVGFDIAGPEDGFPPSRQAEAFALLRDAHVPTTIHAGEAAGVESISGAVGLGAARRIGHGVRIHEDIAGFGTSDPTYGPVAAFVRDNQIPLELCPSSNLQTGAAESIAKHPITGLRDLGFTVTINCDNRLMSGTSLTREMALLVDEAGWSLADLELATLDAAWAVFQSYDVREELAEIVFEAYEGLTE